jgi:hypothetical protein
MLVCTSFLRKQESGTIAFFWIPAYAEILMRGIILQLVLFHSITRDEVIILHDGASPANNEN